MVNANQSLCVFSALCKHHLCAFFCVGVIVMELKIDIDKVKGFLDPVEGRALYDIAGQVLALEMIGGADSFLVGPKNFPRAKKINL